MAANKVFSTFELLERILLAFPPIDVVCCKRVNRTFRDVVNNSAPLQRKLLLLPPLTPTLDMKWRFHSKRYSALAQTEYSHPTSVRAYRVNSALFRPAAHSMWDESGEYFGAAAYFNFSPIDSRGRVISSMASCWNMQLADPPLQDVDVHWTTRAYGGFRGVVKTTHYRGVYRPQGITFGDLVDSLDYDSRSHPDNDIPRGGYLDKRESKIVVRYAVFPQDEQDWERLESIAAMAEPGDPHEKARQEMEDDLEVHVGDDDEDEGEEEEEEGERDEEESEEQEEEDEDIDGVPMEDEDIDGVPTAEEDEDVDGIPM